MKFGELKSIAHNLADSFASGLRLLVGYYGMDIFAEASATPEGYITVDFLTGTTSGGRPSATTAEAISQSSVGLMELCRRHHTEPGAFQTLTVRYAVSAIHGGHFTVTVVDQKGQRSVDQFVGHPGRRVRSHR